MWKKILLILVIGSFMVGTAFAQTYQEAFDAGATKHLNKNYAGARVNFVKALELAPEKYVGKVLLFIGQSYFNEKNYPAARTEYAKVFPVANGHPYYESQAQLQIGICYKREGNTVEAQKAFIKVCEIRNAHLPYVKKAFSGIDKAALGKEEYLKLLDTMLLIIPTPTPDECESTNEDVKKLSKDILNFLSRIKSEQEKLK